MKAWFASAGLTVLVAAACSGGLPEGEYEFHCPIHIFLMHGTFIVAG